MEKELTDNKIDQISSILREDAVAIHNKRRIANKLGLSSGLFEDIMSSSNGDSYETFYKILQEFRGKNEEANVYHITNALTELTLIHAAARVDELQLSDPESDKKNSKQFSKLCTESERNLNPIIGIDLGTTYSAVGVYFNGHVEIIPNNNDTSTLLPSYVSFQRNSLDYVVGYNAKNNLSNNPKNTIYACKRLIGKIIDETDLKESKKRWLFNVVNVEGKAMIELNFPSGVVYKSPEEISALILKELKNKAEAYLQTVVKNVVITVPANFNDSERSATKRAAQIAGLTVIRMINEPTAAALAYGIHCKSKEESFEGRNILVYDLGGGTFDVSVLSVDLNIEFKVGNEPSSAFVVIATKGDMNLGGEDFDYLLLNHLLRKFNFDSSEMISNNEMSKLREASENVKINLSVSEEEIVSITLGGKLYMTKVSRTEFEEICMPKFKRTIEVLNNILVEQDLTPKHIQEVIFIGGSTRIPKIRELVREYLKSNPEVVYNDSINPDEAVSTGAAILGGMLYKSISDFELTDIIFSSIGTSTVGNVMCKMIDKYSQVPTAKSKVFTTIFRGQPSINVRIYEGESEDANENNYLGHFILDGLESIEEPQILITFKVDFDGILHVTAEDKKSGKKNKIDIVRDFAKSENVPR